MKALDYEGRRNVSGERVRQKRTERKITQAELAARVQCEGVALEQTRSAASSRDRGWCRTMSCAPLPKCWAQAWIGWPERNKNNAAG